MASLWMVGRLVVIASDQVVFIVTFYYFLDLGVGDRRVDERTQCVCVDYVSGRLIITFQFFGDARSIRVDGAVSCEFTRYAIFVIH